ncbi:MAG: hypothetical protein DRR08_20310 [Candidatus Parabeggiatoa sp. nov. 2]|nr:MAG: hypothetical protein B6247_17720 [Beggiatoa sp. 4572_84]RKZ56948.1 MAG: hypothetical protein DRR08_20310 [Gammaproteobacteria bacterium]
MGHTLILKLQSYTQDGKKFLRNQNERGVAPYSPNGAILIKPVYLPYSPNGATLIKPGASPLASRINTPYILTRHKKIQVMTTLSIKLLRPITSKAKALDGNRVQYN